MWYMYSYKKDNVELFILNYIKMVKDKLSIEKVRCELNGDKSFERWSTLNDLL